MVLDASKVTARGDGLSLVRVGTPSRFVINAPNAHVNDFEVKIFSKYLYVYINGSLHNPIPTPLSLILWNGFYTYSAPISVKSHRHPL